jgi:hypothetical protein
MPYLKRESPPDLASARNDSLWIGEGNVMYGVCVIYVSSAIDDGRETVSGGNAPRMVIYGIYAAAGEEIGSLSITSS